MITQSKLAANPQLNLNMTQEGQQLINIRRNKSYMASQQEKEPKSFKVALKMPQQKTAMKEEMQALESNHTWDLYQSLLTQISLDQNGYLR